MTEPVIPYASPHHAGLTARGLFGVIVRTFGLILVLWGTYTLGYLASTLAASVPTAGQPAETFLVIGGLWLVLGLALLRGEWLVRFAYGRTTT